MNWWLDISDLDDDQKDVIDLPTTGNYLIIGPPGSGKTNLLLLRAEYLIRSGLPNIFVLMFNDPLHDFIIQGGFKYAVPPDRIKKILSWEMNLLRENGISYDTLPEDDLMEKRKALAKMVLQLVDQNPVIENNIECLLVDEIQDCLGEEIEVFFRTAKHVCFAGDNRQRIYSAHSMLENIKTKTLTIELHTHYRIGHEICKAADAIAANAGLEPIGETCNYRGSDSKVQYYSCSTQEEQLIKLIDNLKIQLTAYPDELLGVVGPRVSDQEQIRDRLLACELAPFILPHRSFGSPDPQQRIYIANILEIKGLEFRTINLVFMEYMSRMRENQKRIAYTASTRGMTTLSIYFTGHLVSYLEQAQVAVEPPRPRPKLDELFPGGSKR